MATSISAVLISCLQSFNQLQERVEQSDYRFEKDVSYVAWGDELGRLRIWAANIGAHQTGQSSLDFRLRDASHISKQITKLLQDLDHSLKDIIDELSEDGTVASEDDETSAAWPEDNSTTELQQLHEDVINIIDCLYQLSMLIRKPAQHDLLVGSRMGDKAEYEFYDKQHVRNLYPRTEEQISQRLGRATTRRRKYFNYRERHHRKLEKGIEEVQGVQKTTTGTVMSETIATDFKTPNNDFVETSSSSGMSQTSYAPSLIDGGRITIPPPPGASAGGKPFECPYCFFVIEVKSTRSWTRHIFKDLKPYVCTFPSCIAPDRLYDSRREWFFHEISEHSRDGFACALCRDTFNSSKQYERHVARHLEELALFALPRNDMEDADSDDGNYLYMKGLDSSSSESSVAEDEEEAGPHAVVSMGTRGIDDPSNNSSAPGYINRPQFPLNLWRAEQAKGLQQQDDIEHLEYLEEHGRFPFPELERSLGVDEPASPVSGYFEGGETKEEEEANWEDEQDWVDDADGDVDEKFARLEKLFLEQKAENKAEQQARETAIEKAAKDKAAKAKADAGKAGEIIETPSTPPKKRDKPIKFQDAIGRRFIFPFDIVKTWSNMEYVIRKAFLHVPDLSPHVTDGQYDLLGPKDEIIIPSIWESVVEPGWEITMHMWPIPEPPPEGEDVIVVPEEKGKKKKEKIPPFMIWTAGKSKKRRGTAKGKNREAHGTQPPSRRPNERGTRTICPE